MTQEQIIAVWRKAKQFPDYDPNQFRCYAYGNLIAFYEYVKLTSYNCFISKPLSDKAKSLR